MHQQREQDELYKLMKPLITAVSEYNTQGLDRALENWEQQREGVLAWGVQSGYFFWVRRNPGKVPTMQQVYEWLVKGGLLGK